MSNRYQSVIITLSNGKTGTFLGKELAMVGDENTVGVTGVIFQEGKELPEGCYFEPLEDTFNGK